jgi:hypothetical protein
MVTDRTGQSPQWAVVPTGEEEVVIMLMLLNF